MVEQRGSITFTALIWLGIILTILGAIAAIFGIGSPTTFEFSFGDLSVKTSQVGLAIMAVGSVLALFTIKIVPEGSIILGDEETYTFTEKLAKRIPLLLIVILIIALGLLIFSIIF